MVRALSLFLICLFGLVSFAAQAKESQRSRECYRLFTNIELSQNENLDSLLNSKGFQRLWETQPETYYELEDFIASVANGTSRKAISTSDFYIDFKIKKTNSSIQISIEKMSVKDRFPYGKQEVPIGMRTRYLNLGFPRLLVAIASGIDRRIAVDSALKNVSIIGAKVVNPELAKQLEQFGFTKRNIFGFKVVKPDKKNKPRNWVLQLNVARP